MYFIDSISLTFRINQRSFPIASTYTINKTVNSVTQTGTKVKLQNMCMSLAISCARRTTSQRNGDKVNNKMFCETFLDELVAISLIRNLVSFGNCPVPPGDHQPMDFIVGEMKINETHLLRHALTEFAK